jgi:hypothetical protein
MVGAAKRLAIYNFGLFVAPYDSSEVKGFRVREPLNFAAAETAEGFVGRSGYAGEPGPECWGRQVFPRFIEGSGFTTAPSSLSLWADIESLMAFSYSGVHADALKHARNWQVPRRWPALVLWWTDHRPDWPGPSAVHFKEPYGPDGEKVLLDRARIRRLSEVNTERHKDLLAAVRGMGV